jgi:hypothetical protein
MGGPGSGRRKGGGKGKGKIMGPPKSLRNKKPHDPFNQKMPKMSKSDWKKLDAANARRTGRY